MKKERPVSVIGIIPARIASTRLPAKPLAKIAGKAMIQHVWENCKKCETLDDLYIATDSQEIIDFCQSFGANVIMTDPDLPSGTDRVYAAYKQICATSGTAGYDLVLNIQGDEPLLKADMIDDMVIKFSNSLSDVGTLIKRVTKKEDLFDPSIVKVTLRTDNTAMYFSRSCIPNIRDVDQDKWLDQGYDFWKHIGIYAYRAEVLEKFTDLPQTDLELAEKLEQLRLMQTGYKFFCVETKYELISVDNPEDIAKVEKQMQIEN